MGPNSFIIYQTVYRQSPKGIFEIVTGLWQNDPEQKSKRETVDQILPTFRFD